MTAIALLDEWMFDESGYDEETWNELKEALNRERGNISARRLFVEEGDIMTAITLNLAPVLHLSDEVFEQLCQANRDAKLERSARGDLIVMPPTGGETGDRNDEMSFQLRAWNKQTRLGKTFNADTGFRLPNGATRSPDASWLSLERWEALTPDQRQKFPPLCPDFVVELRSPTDSLSGLQAKMQEYLNNGARLGWLIDPQSQQVEIYRPGQAIEIVGAPASLSGENVLPGFVLELSEIL